MTVCPRGDQSPGEEPQPHRAWVSTELLYFHFPTSCHYRKSELLPSCPHPPPKKITATFCPRDLAVPNKGRRERSGSRRIYLRASGLGPPERAGRGRGGSLGERAPQPPRPPPRARFLLCSEPLAPARVPRCWGCLKTPTGCGVDGACGAGRSPRRRAGLPLGLRLEHDAPLRPPPSQAGSSRMARQPLRPPRRSRRRHRRPSQARRVPAAARISRRRRTSRGSSRPALPAPTRGGGGGGGAGRRGRYPPGARSGRSSPRPSLPIAPRPPPLSNPPAALGSLPDAGADARHFRGREGRGQ